MIQKELLDILACPQCKGPVIAQGQTVGIACPRCRLIFPVHDQIPVMLIDKALAWPGHSHQTKEDDMRIEQEIKQIEAQYIVLKNHQSSSYFEAIKALVEKREKTEEPSARDQWQAAIDHVYDQVRDEIVHNTEQPIHPIQFGTSGWRGILGKDISCHSVAVVTTAILAMYQEAEGEHELLEALGVASFADMRERGCVLGFDNRFGGPLLALAVANVLSSQNIKIYYAGEATTGALSASVLVHKAAFSINLTPSHNPLEYGGFKYNAADAGPAAPVLTDAITRWVATFMQQSTAPVLPKNFNLQKPLDQLTKIIQEDALTSWQTLVRKGQAQHGIDYDQLLRNFAENKDLVLCIDAVHGASRNYLARLLGNPPPERLILLRANADPTFGGIAPEPSSANMQPVMRTLAARNEPLKIGAIIDPDGDRIRFTDGQVEISMNQFGAMAYHFLHETKKKRGMVAKTVASSNLANALAHSLGEEVFEPKVGFKEFKPVFNKALVCFEESDGISIIGHTPEKDAFIGLILALDITLERKQALGDYLQEIVATYGAFYPARAGVPVSLQGPALLEALRALEQFTIGSTLTIGNASKTISQIIDIDGRKMIFDDGSWIMIRPSGTEPKVRLYAEARTPEDAPLMLQSAQAMLADIGLIVQ